jgi:hypothetical protein
MLEFELFRIQVYPPPQLKLFENPKSPSQILREVIDSLPEAKLRRGMIWHVGNVAVIDNHSLYFRLGRITPSTREIYRNGKFEELTFEEAPYTHVLLDIDLELCAIAKKVKLGARTAPVARQLIRLLNKSEKNIEIQAEFEIRVINDPRDFLTHLQQAHTVSKFWVTFTKSNAWDADEDFYKPMQRLLSDTIGDQGKTEIEGPNLGRESLEELARSAASIGNDAGAILQPHPKSKKIRRSLKGSPAIYNTEEDISDDKTKEQMLKDIREVYNRVRHEQ